MANNRTSTLRFRRRSIDEKRKLIGSHNGYHHYGIDEDATLRAKRRATKKWVEEELAELDPSPQQPCLNSIGVPGFVPGQSFSTDWLIRG